MCEEYLSCINIRKFRNAYIRFRLGCTGLKTNTRSKNVDNADLKCAVCHEIEDETHFLTRCRMYSDIREKYLSRHMPKKNSTNVTYLMKGKDERKIRDIAMFIFYAFERRMQILQGTV